MTLMGKKALFSPILQSNFATKVKVYQPPKDEAERQARFEKLKKKNPKITEYNYDDWRRAISTRKIKNQPTVEKAVERFNLISEKGTTPNVINFNVLFAKCFEKKNLQTAKTFYEKMKEMNVTPDILTFTNLILNCHPNGDFNQALEWKKEAEELNLQKDGRFYDALIRSCIKEANVSLAMEFYSELKSLNVSPTLKTFANLLLVCRQMKNTPKSFQAAKKIFADAKLHSASFNTTLCASYLLCVPDVEILDDEFRSISKLPIGVDVKVIDACINFCSKIPNVDKAEEYFNYMVNNNITPNQYIFYHIMRTCYNDNNIIKGDQYYRRMVFDFKITSFLVNKLHKEIHDDIQEGRRKFVATDVPYANTF